MLNVCLFLALLISFITDIKERKIYNLVTFPTMLIGLIFHTVSNGWDGLQFSFFGILTGFGLLLIPYVLGGMGAGDVKLLGAIGALKGSTFVFQSFFVIAIIGGVIAIAILIHKKEVGFFFKRIFFAMRFRTLDGIDKEDMHHAFPYGVAIVIGTLLYSGVELV
ncbi:A24 family peptidase [Bacillus sp. JJ1533]|uniref:A24 family peptidase n=1 Tax=Bacillus sp. JJ1533 TaxID=3122959 RepID=UPI003000EC46